MITSSPPHALDHLCPSQSTSAPKKSNMKFSMNVISAAWMLLLTLGVRVYSAPALPLEISGDQIAPEFRDGLERNRNFVNQIRHSVQNLMALHASEHPYLFEDQLALLAESHNFTSVHIRSCTLKNFQMETCLMNTTIVLQQYHMYLTSPIVEKLFKKNHQKLEGTRLDLNNLRVHIEDLMRHLDIVPLVSRIESTTPNLQNDYMEKVFVYCLLKNLKKLMENTSRVFSFLLARM